MTDEDHSWKWLLEFHREDRDEWFLWLHGSMEECLEDLMDFKQGRYRGYNRARLVTPERFGG